VQEKDQAPGRPLVDGLPALMAAVGPKSRKQAEQWVFQLRRWLPLQSRALHAYAYILAGTRRWALAAGREAMVDGRLPAIEGVFFYELEEVKEMMTGEWNVSDLAGIHGVAAERMGQVTAWRTEVAPPFLLGDRPAHPAQSGLPGALGQAQGFVQKVSSVQPAQLLDAVVGGVQPDSGWAVFLPTAAGLLAAQGSLLDPAVAAARALGIPAVVELGGAVAELEMGQRVIVDGDRGCVG
jgi:pyruvate,water dikinase